MKRTGIIRIVYAGLMAALFFFAVQPIAARAQAFDESKIRGYDYTGFYGQLGAAVGEVHARGDSDDASGGFTITGGYRMLPWLSIEGNFTYLGNDDDEYFAFTGGPKFYPLGAFKVEAVPHFIQPYGLIGLGGGQFETDPRRGRPDVHDKGSFVARFIVGSDFWVTDHFGLFVEGGGHAASQDHVDGAGIFTLGGQYRF